MPIMWTIDRLQVLRRDKIKYQVVLLSKDLRVLSKERKEEILNCKVYLDQVRSSASERTPLSHVLIIDLQGRISLESSNQARDSISA